MTRVAAIDCGTNSIRPDRRTRRLRWSEGSRATARDRSARPGSRCHREFHPDAVRRTFAAVDQYAELIKKADIGVEKVHFVATSAARDVKNRDGFFAGIKERLGVLPDVISGETEARLSFNGALSRVTPAGEPVLVMDIGGGSTELITGSAAGKMHGAISIDRIGAVTERFLKQNPVADDDLARGRVRGRPARGQRCRLRLHRHLDRGRGHRDDAGRSVSGTGAVRPRAGARRDHPVARHSRAASSTGRMTVEEIRALPSMHPGRADVITGGALVESRIAARLKVENLIVSESDILDGIALQLIGDTMPR